MSAIATAAATVNASKLTLMLLIANGPFSSADLLPMLRRKQAREHKFRANGHSWVRALARQWAMHVPRGTQTSSIRSEGLQMYVLPR